MKRIMLAVLIILVSVVYVGADEVRFDGNFWRQQNRIMKEFFIAGVIGGISAGQDRVLGSAMEGVGDGKISMECFNTVSSLKKSLEAGLMKIEVGQLVDGIDEFYSDFKNRSVKVRWSFLVVMQQIKGTPKEEIEKFIESVRSNPD